MKNIKTISKFEDLGLSRHLVEPLYHLGFEEPTPVQREAIPLILDNKNLIVQAPTGTGKTMAFALPILERLKKAEKSLRNHNSSHKGTLHTGCTGDKQNLFHLENLCPSNLWRSIDR